MRRWTFEMVSLSAALALGALGSAGCRKRSDVQVHAAPGTPSPAEPGSAARAAGEGAEAASGATVDGTEGTIEPAGATGGDGTDEPVKNSREAMAAAAYDALVIGDDGAGLKVLALGDDAYAVVEQAIQSENILAATGALELLPDLSRKGEKRVIALLMTSVQSTVAAIRLTALDVSVRAPDLKLPLEIVQKLIADAELDVRATACDTLLSYQDRSPASVAAVFAGISDESDVVRAACSDAFGRLGTATGHIEALAKMLESDRAHVREGATRALGDLRAPEGYELLRGRLSDPDPSVAATAAAAIGRFANADAVRDLEPILKDERRGVRVEAVAALMRPPAELVRNLVYEALKDRDATVRLEAAAVLVRFPDDPETTIRLHALLRDEEASVREITTITLGDLRNPRSFGPLLARLTEETEEQVRAAIVLALVAIDPSQAVPHLIDRLEGSKGAEQTQIIANLRRVTGESLPLDAAKWKAWYAAQPKPATDGGGVAPPEGAPGGAAPAAPTEGAPAVPAPVPASTAPSTVPEAP
ncbi:MAG: HEAT repeat domain-containing protein [Myxococcales bacterium]|nr:HEAT repeat domain-containing protein [Myxococcales bacterium]